MTEEDIAVDELLFRAAPEPPPGAREQESDVDAGELLAWLEGDLDDDARDEMAGRLAASPAARQLLVDLERARAEGDVEGLVQVTPTRRRQWPPLAGAVGVTALAASLLLVFLPSAPVDLPGYVPDALRGGVSKVKSGDAPASATFVPDSQVEWVLRPQTRLVEPLPVGRAFFAPDGAKLLPLDPAALERVEGGSFVLRGRAADLFGERYGRLTLAIAVARETASLDGVKGLDPSAARALSDVLWLATSIEYRAALAP